MPQVLASFWNLPAEQVLHQLNSSPQGLSRQEAQQRLIQYGANSLKQKRRSHTLPLLLNQFKSPIILILMAAALLSSFLGDAIDAIIILAIVLVSGFLGFWQERGAADAIQKLLALVEVKARILRDGEIQDIPINDVVPGDVVQVSAGDSIPGDCLILESQTLSVDEATLTGETYPVSKVPGILPVETGLSQRTNSLLMGTHIVSGSAQAVVIHTGKMTEFGKVSERLKFRPPETEFESGIRKFGYFLLEVTLILVVLIFAANVYLKRPMLDSFLFSLALAVGLTPLLTDFPEMTIATDRVDREQVSQPHRWDIRFIRNFMLVFGLLSSVFDYLTFAALLFLLHADSSAIQNRLVYGIGDFCIDDCAGDSHAPVYLS